MKLSIIVPAYNEEKAIAKVIKEIKNTAEKITNDYEILIVDDGSRDLTYSEAKKLEKLNSGKIKVLSYGKNKGKGFALRYGFFRSSGDFIAFIDADMDLHPSQIKNLFEIMEKRRVDIVVGSKRHKKSKLNYPLKRKILSEIYFMICKILFNLNVRDSQTGLKLFKRKVLQDIMPKILVKKYAFDVELLANAKRKGYKIVEAPVKLNFKHNSKINLKEIFNMLVDTLAIAYRMYIKKYYDRS